MSSFIVDVNRVSNVAVNGANPRGSSCTITEAVTIYEKLEKAAQNGDIKKLYELIAEDPNILDRFHEVSFCQTPLHIAAENGQADFSMELMTLKPSLASKLNVSGFSPIHLALQNNHMRVVRGFVAMDSSLVSIKGRGRITPLHHLAQTGDAEMLSELLFACPSSIEDLTNKCETVVHVAVKNRQLMAFKALLGWIKRVKKEEILDWKDVDGNTVFHTAASMNQTEVMKLLRKTVKVNAKNLAGKTATDLLESHQPPCFSKPRRLLRSVKERLLCRSPKTLAGYLSKNLSFMEKRNNLLGLSNLSLTRARSVNTSDSRNAILVVAVLIVTATYQASLSPPGGFLQEDTFRVVENEFGQNVTERVHRAGEMTMDFENALFFVMVNAVGFFSSLFVIITLIIGLPMWKLIYGSTAALSIAMLSSNLTILPDSDGINDIIVGGLFILGFPLIIQVTLLLAFVAFLVHKGRRNRVDFPASCFSTSDGSHVVSFLLLLGGICLCFWIFFS